MIGHYQDLAGKTFLVTGASSGIGRTIAIALAQQQAHVIITGRESSRLNQTLEMLNSDSRAIICNLTDAEDRDRLEAEINVLDGICHAAGIIDPLPVRFVDRKRFDKVFEINAIAPILLTSRLLGAKKLNADASIVFISSIASSHSMKGGSLYSASKAALESFSKSIVMEHASKRIRANCLKPALVRTPMYDQVQHLSLMGGLESSEAQYPLGLGAPEDIAAATLFLLSGASRWIASTSIIMDGGLTAGT
jgi:NAD(P)-dependent dehydrogenase (short-subunit alcohol dehydrogenase family)